MTPSVGVASLAAGPAVTIRPAAFDDAPFLCSLVARLGSKLPRIGAVPTDDPFAVIDAVWHRAAAVFVATDAGDGSTEPLPFAIVTIYDLDLLHRTAWIEAHHPPEVSDTHLDVAVWSVVHHARRAWNLRTIRTLDPVSEIPLFATIGGQTRFEGEIPGGCPGASPSTGALRALDLETDHVD